MKLGARRRLDLVGLAEIARMFGVRKQTVSNWRARDPFFPKPYVELACGSIYERSAILNWKPEIVRATHSLHQAPGGSHVGLGTAWRNLSRERRR